MEAGEVTEQAVCGRGGEGLLKGLLSTSSTLNNFTSISAELEFVSQPVRSYQEMAETRFGNT